MASLNAPAAIKIYAARAVVATLATWGVIRARSVGMQGRAMAFTTNVVTGSVATTNPACAIQQAHAARKQRERLSRAPVGPAAFAVGAWYRERLSDGMGHVLAPRYVSYRHCSGNSCCCCSVATGPSLRPKRRLWTGDIRRSSEPRNASGFCKGRRLLGIGSGRRRRLWRVSSRLGGFCANRFAEWRGDAGCFRWVRSHERRTC